MIEEDVMDKADFLTDEERMEQELWKKYKETENPELENQIIKKYLYLVKYVAGKIPLNPGSGVEFEDYCGFGVLGLLDAVRKFDLGKNTKFKTYAIIKIRGAIIDEMRKLDFFPRSVHQTAKAIEDNIRILEEKLERVPSDEEIAEHMNISVQEFRRKLQRVSCTTIISLNEQWASGDNDKLSLLDTLESPAGLNPETIAERKEIIRVVSDAIMTLPEKERQVLFLYYKEELTLKEIGNTLDVTESRISQLHAKAVLTLRTRLSNSRRGIC